MLKFAALLLGSADMFAIGRDFIAQALIQQSLPVLGEGRGQRVLAGDRGCMAEGRCLHKLQILLILRGSTTGHFIDPLAGVALIQPPISRKGGKELVVAAEARRGHKAAHGEGVDEPIVKILVCRG